MSWHKPPENNNTFATGVDEQLRNNTFKVLDVIKIFRIMKSMTGVCMLHTWENWRQDLLLKHEPSLVQSSVFLMALLALWIKCKQWCENAHILEKFYIGADWSVPDLMLDAGADYCIHAQVGW